MSRLAQWFIKRRRGRDSKIPEAGYPVYGEWYMPWWSGMYIDEYEEIY